MDDIESMKYYMAAEKTMNMINVMSQSMEFFEEFKIKPDTEVKKALSPLIDQIRNWLKDEK